jgi:hypothetical protein
VTVAGNLHMPPLDGATGWLNSEPLELAELRGHVTVRERTLEITFLEPGAEAYVFTFG